MTSIKTINLLLLLNYSIGNNLIIYQFTKCIVSSVLIGGESEIEVIREVQYNDTISNIYGLSAHGGYGQTISQTIIRIYRFGLT